MPAENGAAPLRILYAGSLSENDTALYRLWALRRLGHEVVPVNTIDYEPAHPLVRKITFRLAAGPSVDRMNADLLQMAEREKPDLFWGDKLLGMQPSALDRLRSLGIPTISYMIDNPFGTRRDPGWRLYMKAIPHWDLHIVQRDKNIADYRSRGARDVLKIQTAYEPSLQYPPPAQADGRAWSDRDRTRDVSFIGTPYDDRAAFLSRLWREFGFNVAINGGPVWEPALGPEATPALYKGRELYREKYAEGIWRSKINLSFITHANQDEFVHKSFEIAGCGGFLLAERSDGHKARFIEDEEAVFFSGIEECVAKIRRYLPDEAARSRIAAAGCLRAQRSGYHNDRQMQIVVERARQILAASRTAQETE